MIPQLGGNRCDNRRPTISPKSDEMMCGACGVSDDEVGEEDEEATEECRWMRK